MRQIGRREGLGAFRRQLGHCENIGGRMQVALRVTADQLLVLGERHVAFEDAGAHPGARPIGLFGVLGELQRRTAMAYGEGGALKRPLLAGFAASP
jgi:hypothetical protein